MVKGGEEREVFLQELHFQLISEDRERLSKWVEQEGCYPTGEQKLIRWRNDSVATGKRHKCTQAAQHGCTAWLWCIMLVEAGCSFRISNMSKQSLDFVVSMVRSRNAKDVITHMVMLRVVMQWLAHMPHNKKVPPSGHVLPGTCPEGGMSRCQ